MPNRYFRDGLLDSEAVSRAGELAEVLFVRLMLVADDFARFDGRVTVICRRCWPGGGPQEDDVEERLQALARERLALLYEVDGKRFIYIPKFNQRTRAGKSKYPDPPAELLADYPHESDSGPSRDWHAPDDGQASASGVRPRGSTATGSSLKQQHETQAEARARPAAAAAEEPKPEPDTPSARLIAECQRAGIDVTRHDQVMPWLELGATPSQVVKALEIARTPGRKPFPERLTLAYVDPILREVIAADAAARATGERGVKRTQEQLAEQRRAKEAAAPMPEAVRAKTAAAQRKPAPSWWMTPAGIAAKGREQDMVRSPNEEPVMFKCRLFARLGDGPWMDSLTKRERAVVDRYSAKPPKELTGDGAAHGG